MWQIFNKDKEVNHLKCLELLFSSENKYNGADPNIELAPFTPHK
jgi:hypothetical protein